MQAIISLKRIRSHFKKVDIVLITLVLISTVFGILLIASATKSSETNRYIIVQSCAALMGIAAIYIFTKIDYEDLSAFAWHIYIFYNALLLFTLIFGVGADEKGTNGWLRFFGIGIQPAEIAKVGFIITLAAHLDKVSDDLNCLRNIVMLLLHLAVPLALILFQPDFGTAMVFIAIFCFMIFAAGVDKRYILSLGASALLAAPIIYFFFFGDIQKNRIKTFLFPGSDVSNLDYHVIQMKIAIGSGGIFGSGLFKGPQTQLGYLPEKHNDSIFSVCGEELGLIGTVAVILLLFGIILRVFHISQNAKDKFGSLMCVGIVSYFFFHVFENIGMAIGIMPVTGIPLPFFSYGGSALLTNFTAIALALNVFIKQRHANF